jgi:hypothetical protein
VTTGAAGDLQQVTGLAKQVTKHLKWHLLSFPWSLSDACGISIFRFLYVVLHFLLYILSEQFNWNEEYD